MLLNSNYFVLFDLNNLFDLRGYLEDAGVKQELLELGKKSSDHFDLNLEGRSGNLKFVQFN